MSNSNALKELSSEERLKVYKQLTDGCQHLWSKGKMDKEKVIPLIQQFVLLGYSDPEFLARFTSWVFKNSNSKDLQVISTFANSLNSADGMPFTLGKKEPRKPDWRSVSSAAIQMLDPKLALRVRQVATEKFDVPNILPIGTHYTTRLAKAIKKYIKYREKNVSMMQGIRKSGLRRIMMNLYRLEHLNPSDEIAGILNWQQKNRKIKIKKSPFDFSKMKPIQIAEKIRKDKLSVLGVIGALPKITPTIAVALLENAKPDEAIILRKTFEDAGVLADKEVMALYEEKVKASKIAIDRVRNIKGAGEKVTKVLKTAKAETRKAETKDMGKIFMHIDISGSMESAIDFAKENGSIIAEMVNSPEENFRWGAFNDRGKELKLPDKFEEDYFKARLFGLSANGSTDCFATYGFARAFGTDVDVYITDGGHNVGDLEDKIKHFHEVNDKIPKPKCVVIIKFRTSNTADTVERAFETNGIPVAILKPEAITGSALVAQSVATALRGQMAIIDGIMQTPFLELPEWWWNILIKLHDSKGEQNVKKAK
jgi:hypothetical protein